MSSEELKGWNLPNLFCSAETENTLCKSISAYLPVPVPVDIAFTGSRGQFRNRLRGIGWELRGGNGGEPGHSLVFCGMAVNLKLSAQSFATSWPATIYLYTITTPFDANGSESAVGAADCCAGRLLSVLWLSGFFQWICKNHEKTWKNRSTITPQEIVVDGA